MRVLLVWSLCSAIGCFVAPEPSGVVPPGAMREGPRWSSWEAKGVAPRVAASVTITARGVALFGGLGAGGPVGDGWLCDRGAWTPLGAEGAPSARVDHAAVWTGDALCVWGGFAGREALGDGACWDPRADAWRPMASEGAPSPRGAHAAVWTARGMLVFGGRDAEGEALDDGALYDPREDRWTALPAGGPKARWGAALLGDGRGARVALWGGAGEQVALGGDDAAWFDAEVPRWSRLSTEGAPLLRTGPQWVAAEGVLVVLAPGAARFDLATGRWRPLPGLDAPAPRLSATRVATPGAAVFWGGLDADGARGDGAAYLVRDDRWVALPREGAPSPRSDAVGFWDGAAVRVLWGRDASGLRGDAYALTL